ncbi:phosphoribosylaminoimidazole carboxylase, putative [Actinidia rufa]|uniref:phosphoribosylaminoimidazole carboxylase n=1 Tax=Actinidia rufa TaxID=165716 RepID=A0A7J0D9A7_9ERIC|nr:phosphoribosylaminoimidazole carboxylase, putative [Actinidia rufa]
MLYLSLSSLLSGHRMDSPLGLAFSSRRSLALGFSMARNFDATSSSSSSLILKLHCSLTLPCRATLQSHDTSQRKDNLPVHGVSEVIVGVLGGGQLGRMLCQAASQMAIKVNVLDPMENCPASALSHYHMVGSYDDGPTVEEFAKRFALIGTRCGVLTVEIEHVDAETLERLERQGIDCQPKASTIRIIQDKYLQKVHFSRHAIPLPEFMQIDHLESAKRAGELFGYPLMIKSKRLAYDGRGNAVAGREEEISSAVNALGGYARGLYVEKWASFSKELAVIVARGRDGSILCYPVVETIHRENICHVVKAPANVPWKVRKLATDVAYKAVSSLEGAGIFAVELFLTRDGQVLLNEVAPRPHNSGHHTIESCFTSQFEQLLRAVVGLPLGDPSLKTPAAIMYNILGEDEEFFFNLAMEESSETSAGSQPQIERGSGTPTIYESSNLRITTTLFNGQNYLSWSRSAILSLKERGKLGYVNGTITAPPVTDSGYGKWDIENSHVINRLVHSMVPSIGEGYLHVDYGQGHLGCPCGYIFSQRGNRGRGGRSGQLGGRNYGGRGGGSRAHHTEIVDSTTTSDLTPSSSESFSSAEMETLRRFMSRLDTSTGASSSFAHSGVEVVPEPKMSMFKLPVFNSFEILGTLETNDEQKETLVEPMGDEVEKENQNKVKDILYQRRTWRPRDKTILPDPPLQSDSLDKGSGPGFRLAHQLIERALSISGATVHWYDKPEMRKQRKMGHITIIGASLGIVEARMKSMLNEESFDGQTAVTPRVGIIMGSDSDLPVMKDAARILDMFGVPYELRIVSAHRTPEMMFSYASSAGQRGIQIIIAGAGGAAHLPGMVAALTPLPVIGVPVRASSLDGLDSLLSIVQMPRGVPVATVAINNATNAGLLAVRMLGVGDADLQARMSQYLEDTKHDVLVKAEKLEKDGWEAYLNA